MYRKYLFFIISLQKNMHVVKQFFKRVTGSQYVETIKLWRVQYRVQYILCITNQLISHSPILTIW
jgi:hypothetical protein